ncbi:MAG: hydroxyacid dehydrogenase [Gammaproteobacteria bacterium CG11_big_fil_rev_8_21_14_0_20_46_22]|nr:MAG: hydroxyacid dehydrogenase [Gammaproteobacteria bacterium CG11_big_fil_rev_8_21_14_0_20_46_22]
MPSLCCYSTQAELKTLLEPLGQIVFTDEHLNASTCTLAQGCDTVCAFVTDTLNRDVLCKLAKQGIRHIALRTSGYDHVDLSAADEFKLIVTHVPAYSPQAIAEHAAALTLMLSHKLQQSLRHQAHLDFRLSGLLGFNLHQKTVGVIGAGSIGACYVNIMKGFGAKLIAYDPYPKPDLDVEYTSLSKLFEQSDVVSLHCPLTSKNRYLINTHNLQKMKPNAILINTARGGLVDTKALLYALDHNLLAGAGLDVYEFEKGVFFESLTNLKDPLLNALLAKDNVVITPHQAFFTQEALENVADIVTDNIQSFWQGIAKNTVEKSRH